MIIATLISYGCCVQLLKTTKADSDWTCKLWHGSKAKKLEKVLSRRPVGGFPEPDVLPRQERSHATGTSQDCTLAQEGESDPTR